MLGYGVTMDHRDFMLTLSAVVFGNAICAVWFYCLFHMQKNWRLGRDDSANSWHVLAGAMIGPAVMLIGALILI